jgi:DNA-binding NtrC family response regulator
MNEDSKKQPAILVIDDDEQVQSLLKEILRDENDCAVAGSAEDALALLKSDSFDLVISDKRACGRNGDGFRARGPVAGSERLAERRRYGC